ncbi:MAG TPA: YaiO family outer membrane beta-barrel protein [Thermoanaerobaculia bacterium]|nr:YaiO family outer membrane beta-barrel protein [Thermoanaerobaculia bacterium]
MTWMIAAFNWIETVLIVYVAAINVMYLLLILLGYFVLRRERPFPISNREQLLRSPLLPSIAVIAPAYNESATCRQSVRNMLALRYPNHEVIVVNDGSKDDTLQILIDEFKLYRSGRVPLATLTHKPIRAIYESRDPIRLVVIDKENGGKADSLNAGINLARANLVCAVDSDSLIEQDALLYVAKPFLEDASTIASGGIIRVVNGCRVEGGQVVDVRAPRRLLPLFQAVEYLRAFLGGRVAFSFLNALLIISGAFGLFDRKAVVEAGGYQPDAIGEDMELIVRLHRIWRSAGRSYRVVFVPEPVCWTEVPEKLRILRSQRNRWQRGTVDSIRRNLPMLLNPRYGTVGLMAMPYFLLFEMIGPSIELLGYELTLFGIALALIAPQTAVLFLIVSILFGILLSMSAVALEELTKRRYPAPADLARLFAAAILENLGMRQLMTVWRTRGLIDGLRGRKKGWGIMERRGFVASVLAILIWSAAATPPLFADEVARARQLAVAGQRHEALQILEQRIAAAPNDIDALTLYGIVLSWEGDRDRARRALNWALLHDPKNGDAREALARLNQWKPPTTTKNEVTLGATYDDFEDSDPWREAEFDLKMNMRFGAAVLRGAHARRFDLDDDQVELELYPRLGDKGYAYFDAGYSPHARLYPRSRFGAEFFQGFGPGLEASLGYRRLNFVSGVNIYTGSFSKYAGDWLFTLRGYRSEDTNSLQGMIRRYLGDADRYIGLRIGKGSTRDEIRSITDLAVLDSLDATAEARFGLRGPWLMQIRAGAGRQRVPGRHQRHTAASVLLGLKF